MKTGVHRQELPSPVGRAQAEKAGGLPLRPGVEPLDEPIETQSSHGNESRLTLI
jgi:hypothetical protein